MFERFTRDAREVVVGAQHEATRLHAGRIGTEHLLLALLDRPGSSTSTVLARHGLTHDAVTRSSSAPPAATSTPTRSRPWASTSTPSAPRSRPRSGPGPSTSRSGARPAGIPFSPRAKKVLQLALREAIALDQKSIGDGHIALGLLREGQGLAMKVLADLGVDAATLRRDVRAALT